MNAITAVFVNDDASYTKGTINSFSSGKLLGGWRYDGSYGPYKALKVTGFSSSDYPLTVKISATDYEDIVIKVEKIHHIILMFTLQPLKPMVQERAQIRRPQNLCYHSRSI